MIMATGFAQTENVNQRRSRQRGHHVRSDRETCLAAEKLDFRRGTAVMPVSHHCYDLAAPHCRDQRQDIRWRSGDWQQIKLRLRRIIKQPPDFPAFVVEGDDVYRDIDTRQQLAGRFPVSNMPREQEHAFAVRQRLPKVLFSIKLERKMASLAAKNRDSID